MAMATDIYARIRQAAFELVGEGVWPTVVEVRARLGSGSNTTINNTLKEWRQEFLSRMSLSAKRPDWPAGLAEAFELLWQKACDEADRQLDAVRQESQSAVTAMAQQLDEQLQQLQAREASLQSALRELELKNQRVADLESALAAESARRGQLEASAQNLESMLASMRQDAMALRRESDERVAELEARAEQRIQEERNEAARREALAYERLEGLRVRLYEQVEEERLAMTQQQQRLNDELQQARQEIARQDNVWRERLAERERENGRLAARLEWLDERCASLEQETQRQGGQLEQSASRLLAMAGENSHLAAELAAGAQRYLEPLSAALLPVREQLAQMDAEAVRNWLSLQLQASLSRPETAV